MAKINTLSFEQKIVNGMFTRGSVDAIPDDKASILYNVDTSVPGKRKKRLGAVTVLDDLGASPIIKMAYLKAPSVDARMCFIYGQRLYKSTTPLEESGSWVDIDSTDHFTADVKTTTFVVCGAKLFMSNGTDNVFSYDGTSITDEGDTNTDPPKAKVGAYIKNRLWLANTSTSPDFCWFSDTIAPQTWDRTTNVFKVSTGDGTDIMAMVPYQESSLIILKEDSIHELLISGDTSDYWNLRPIDTVHGCIAYNCALEYQGVIYYLSRDGVRTYPMADAMQLPLSWEIDDYVATINWDYATNAQMIVHNNKLYVAVPTGTSTYNDSVMVYDFTSKGWSIITGWNVGCWGIYVEKTAGNTSAEEEVLMYGDSNDGTVKKCFKSTQFNDNATAINYQEETKKLNFGYAFKKIGDYLEVVVDSSTGNTVTVSSSVDGAAYASLGTCTATTKFNLKGLGRFDNIKFKLQNDATSTEQLIMSKLTATARPCAYRRE